MSKNFIPIEPLDDGCVLGKKQTGKNPYWYVRMYWKSADKPQSEYKSTKILYEDSQASRLKAKRKAGNLIPNLDSVVREIDNLALTVFLLVIGTHCDFRHCES